MAASQLFRGKFFILLYIAFFHLKSSEFFTCSSSYVPRCRDPDLGGQELQIANLTPGAPTTSIDEPRKFLIIGGSGAGIGNFLIFFPAAYYFAALTGREILIADDSLIGEMCQVIECGFPLLSDTVAAYPDILPNEAVKGVKVSDFIKHLRSEVMIEDTIVQAHGFMAMPGWYLPTNGSDTCVALLTGCGKEDTGCHDRHALQRLVRGPFKDAVLPSVESRIHGAPKTLKHAMLKLPHAYVPRLDAAVHLRCQFKYFEQLIDSDDGALWEEAKGEVGNWLNSTDKNMGKQLFKSLADKIVEQIPSMTGHPVNIRKLIGTGGKLSNGSSKDGNENEGRRKLNNDKDKDKDKHKDKDKDKNKIEQKDKEKDKEVEKEEVFKGTHMKGGNIYVYVASDNEEVKEAFVSFLDNYHPQIRVMRVVNNGRIHHAKNTEYVKSAGNNTGIEDLTLDWYALTLSDTILAWRKDTKMLSTYAQSAQRMTGHTEAVTGSAHTVSHGKGAQGFQLTNNGWQYF